MTSKEAGLTAALAAVNQVNISSRLRLSFLESKSQPQDCDMSKAKQLDVLDSREMLEEEIMKKLDEIADLHCQNILNIDCSNKETRNKRVISRLEVCSLCTL